MFERRVLGIDPGLSRCGYACLQVDRARQTVAIAMGVITTSPHSPLPSRLAELQDELALLMDQLKPDAVAVEQVFFQVNVRTAMGVGQASGLALAAAAARGCEVVQYTPNQVKETVAGWGGADKQQVARMVQARLRLPELPKPADAADAAAIALTHLAVSPVKARISAAVVGR